MGEQSESRIDQLCAYEEIRKVLYLYARAVDRCDGELLRQLYHEDSTHTHGVIWAGNGKDLADFLMPVLAKMPYNHHAITNPVIELDGDRAFVESQFDSTHRLVLDDDGAVDRRVQGRYLDVFARRDGRWRILHRRIVIDATWGRELPMAALTGPAAQTRPPHPELVSGRAPDDPVYRGFGIAEIMIEPFTTESDADKVQQQYR